MSDKGSVFSKGGGGTNFEQYVQTAFLTTMIVRGNLPCLPPSEISEVAFQTTSLGYKTDDLCVTAKSALAQHRLLIQIKTNLIFSSDNAIFKEVIKAFWEDFNNTRLFDKNNDRLVIIKSGLNSIERNHIKVLLNWAKLKSSSANFILEVNRIDVKKERLEIFRTVIQEVNDGQAISDDKLWMFLKCLEVLDYDFAYTGSKDKAYFLNLIKLSKQDSVTANESDIWNSLLALATEFNSNGGSVSLLTIQREDIYKYFNIEKLSPIYESIRKLKEDSQVILGVFTNTIKGLHIERPEIIEEIIDYINRDQVTIITGAPGTGKSAIAKDILTHGFSDTSIFIFKADQFNEPHLATVLSNFGVHKSIPDILSCISLIPKKIIVLDAMEKLLESDPENSFKQLLSLLKEHTDIKIIGTSRKYAVDLLIEKFGIEKLNVIDIPLLSDKETEIVVEKFPSIKPLFANEKIAQILKSPKYIDYAISSFKSGDDYSKISLTEFKNKLWESIVENISVRKEGLPSKRGNAFLKIAVQRAKKMCLFVAPTEADAAAIDCLENDGVIYKEKNYRKYAPSHDILEDWALVKYVEAKGDEFKDPKEFFKNVGSEPAIRRAFRLWVEDYLVDNQEKVLGLIRGTLGDAEIEKHWVDELLIAVFKSDNSGKFFKAFETELLENDAFLLNRCLHLIRTTCKESKLTGKADSALLFPIGSGWSQAIIFIKKHIDKLDGKRFTILNLLSDWEFVLFKLPQSAIPEINDVKDILLHYIKQIESGDNFWELEGIQSKKKNLISLLFNIASVSKDEIKELVERAFIKKDDHGNWKLCSFYKDVIKYCLSSVYSRSIAKELPELIIDIAEKQWKVKPKKVENVPSFYSSIRHIDKEECWGIENNLHLFPPGVHKIPIYNLLFFHPVIGVKFIVEFVNYSVISFVNSDFEYKNEITEVEIELNDGKIIKQFASWELWAAYRGQSVTNYLLESILMSIEKYLMELAQVKTETSRKHLQFLFNYLLSNSNNVAVMSVLTSVAIAFPEEVEKEMLPILSAKEFFHWDINRSIHEASSYTLAPYDEDVPFAQEEKIKSNQLPHRTKYQRGLIDFIINYQFNIRKLNKEIHNVFDKLKLTITDDVVWKKTLNEIDIRNWEAGEYDEKLGGIPIQPKYDEKVKEFLESNKEDHEAQNIALGVSSWIRNCYEKKNGVEVYFQKWEECYNHYISSKNPDYLHDRPITLAMLGLKDFKTELSKKQNQWCVEIILEGLRSILKDEFNRDFSTFPKVSVFEKGIALTSFSLLFNNISDSQKQEGIGLLLYTIMASIHDHEIQPIIKCIRNDLFKSHPDIAKRAWIGLIKYSQFRNANPHFYNNSAEQIKANKKEETFIQGLIKDTSLKINIAEIDFDSYEGRLLSRAFTMTPYDLDEEEYTDFIKKFLYLLINDLQKAEEYSYRKSEGRKINFDKILSIEKYLTELLLFASAKISEPIIDILVDSIHNLNISQSQRHGDLFDFVTKTLENIIYKLDEIIANSNDEVENKRLINKFWTLWTYLSTKISNSKKNSFTRLLLLDISWKTEATHWKPFEINTQVYLDALESYGHLNFGSVIKFFSTVGENTFLPDKITWLVYTLKKYTLSKHLLATVPGERLIKRLFHNHLGKIKQDQHLMDDFIWILDEMVEMGSSLAYMIRENVITYKVVLV